MTYETMLYNLKGKIIKRFNSAVKKRVIYTDVDLDMIMLDDGSDITFSEFLLEYEVNSKLFLPNI